MTSWESLKRTLSKLWHKPVKKKVVPKRTLDDIVGDYFKVDYNRDIVALADCLQMSIPDIYFGLQSESHKANVRGFAPKEDQLLIGTLIHKRAFGLLPVYLEVPSKKMKVEHESLAQLLDWLRLSAKSPQAIWMKPHDMERKHILVSYRDVAGNVVLGIISNLNIVQYDKLLEQYGGA